MGGAKEDFAACIISGINIAVKKKVRSNSDTLEEVAQFEKVPNRFLSQLKQLCSVFNIYNYLWGPFLTATVYKTFHVILAVFVTVWSIKKKMFSC